MNRETKRIIEHGKDKAVVRATIRHESFRCGLTLPLAAWLRVQPSSTRKGVSRGNFELPIYVIPEYVSVPVPVI